jgi:hypothetical protein
MTEHCSNDEYLSIVVREMAEHWCNTPGVKNVICTLIVIANLVNESNSQISFEFKSNSRLYLFLIFNSKSVVT